MTRRSFKLAAVAVGLLPFSSCTCYRETPEPPAKVAARPNGFGAMITPRTLPDRIEGEAPEPTVEARQALAPTISTTPEPAAIPDNFPQDIPIPEGSNVLAVQHLANDARSVIFATEGDSPQLFSFYKDSMKKTWGEPTQQYQGKEQSFLSFKKGETITNISVSKDPKTGKRIVAVMYYDEKPLPFPEF